MTPCSFIRYPREIESLPEIRLLISEMGTKDALYTVFRLFTDLAYQCEAHGHTGFLEEAYVADFEARLGIPGAIEKLVKAKILTRIESPDKGYTCRVFACFNYNLDVSYCDLKSQNVLNKFWESSKHDLPKMVASIRDKWNEPVEFMDALDGSGKIPDDELSLAMVCLRTLESVWGNYQAKGVRECRPAEIQVAHAAAKRYGLDGMTAILSRISILYRSEKICKYPSHLFLLEIDLWVKRYMPEEFDFTDPNHPKLIAKPKA